MDDKMKDQLQRWHEDDEHQKIVDTLEALPEGERDYALTGLLARAYNNLGQVGETAPFERAAVLLLGTAARVAEDRAWHFRLGYAYYYLDRDEEALAEFQRALELDPTDDDAKDFISDLSRRCFQAMYYTEEEMDAVEAHIQAHFGPVVSVFHELASPDIHVDICIVEPTEEKPFYTLVTMGMGARPMSVPEELKGEGLDRAEIAVCLPPDWELQNSDERWYWPLRWLKILARLPIGEDSWLGWGHTVPNGEPMAEDTALAGVMLVAPPFGEGCGECALPGGQVVNFYQMLPIYEEEMAFKVAHSAEALLERMDEVSPVLDRDRPNCCEDWVDEDSEDDEDEAEDGLTFLERTEAFWSWFEENEDQLRRMAEDPDQFGREAVADFVAQGAQLLSEDVRFNMGGDHEFTFAVEGNTYLWYLLPYVVAAMPEQFKDKWRFFPGMPGAGGQAFGFEMYGCRIDMAQVQVLAEYDPEGEDFSIRFYEPGLCALEEGQCYNAFTIMMEISLGEGLAQTYVDDVRRAETPEPGMFPLNELERHIRDTLAAQGKKVLGRPDQHFSVYSFEPEENQELRFDVISGMSCCLELVSGYYAGRTGFLSSLAACGAKAGFLAFPYDPEGDRDAVLAHRHELEDRLEAEVLGKRESGEELGLLLGAAICACTAYIDVLAYDLPAFLDRAVPILEEYPYPFYFSPFRQDCELIQLTGEAGE